MTEGGRIRTHCVPSLRGLEPELRKKRLIAARRYAAHSIPRFAILLGQWDAGEVVGMAAVRKEREVGKRRRGKDREANQGATASAKRRRKPRKV